MKRIALVSCFVALVAFTSGCGGAGTDSIPWQSAGEDTSIESGPVFAPPFVDDGEDGEETIVDDAPLPEPKPKKTPKPEPEGEKEKGVAPTCSAEGLPAGKLGVPYSGAITTNFDDGEYFLAKSGAFPDGLALEGMSISGTPKESGTWTGKIVIKRKSSTKGSCEFSITITEDAPKLAVSDAKWVAEAEGNRLTLSPDGVAKVEIEGNAEEYGVRVYTDNPDEAVCVGTSAPAAGESSCPKPDAAKGKVFFFWLSDAKDKGDGSSVTISVRPIGNFPEKDAATVFIAFQHSDPKVLKLEAPTVKDSYGTDGGGEFTDSCPEGQTVTRIALRTGGSVDQIAIACEPIATLESEDLEPTNSANGKHGGEGGGPHDVVAPRGFAFVGFELNTNGDGVFEIKPIARRVRTSGIIDLFDWDPGRTYGGSDGNYWNRALCNKDEVLTGIHGRSGSLLYRLGPICSKFVPIAKAPNPPKIGKASPVFEPDPHVAHEAGECPLTCQEGDKKDVITGIVGRTFMYNGPHRVIGTIALRCAPVVDGKIDKAKQWQTNACGSGQHYAVVKEFDISFPDGFTATGFRHRDGERLDRLSVYHAPLSLIDDIAQLYNDWDEETEDCIEEDGINPLKDHIDGGVVRVVPIGGEGGGKRGPNKCATGSVLTGITFYAGDDVDDVIGYECAKVQ